MATSRLAPRSSARRSPSRCAGLQPTPGQEGSVVVQKLQVKLLEILPKLKERESVRFSASINEPRGKDFLPLLEVKAGVEQTFIVAGQSYKTGMLALVMRVVK